MDSNERAGIRLLLAAAASTIFAAVFVSPWMVPLMFCAWVLGGAYAVVAMEQDERRRRG